MKKPKSKIIFLAIIFFGVFGMAKSSEAANHYIREGATGSNNGSDWTNAWTTLPAALTRGDTYYIADGSYGGYTFDDAVSGEQYITIKKAISSDHGTSAGWQDGYGTDSATFSGWTFNTGYYYIDGQTGGGPSSWDSGFGIVVSSTKGKRIIFNSNANHISINHTEVTNADNTPNDVDYGSLVYSYNNVTYVTFSYCKIHHVFGCCFQTGSAGIDNWTIEYSKVGDNTGTSANHSEIWSMNGVDNWTWKHNYIYAWRSTGCFFGTGPGIDGTGDYNMEENYYIYGNIFDQAGTTASWLIAAINDGSYDFHYARGWRVYNNTFIDINSTSNGVNACALHTTGIADNEFKNNIFYGNTDIMQVYGATEDYNSYQGSSQFFTGLNDILLTSSPFANYSGGDYRLAATLAGISLSSPFHQDLLGNTRGSDSTWDRGAYEYVSGGDTTPPAAPSGLSVN